MAPSSLLFSQMTPPPELEAEFNAWYDDEHVPARTVLPGFRSARRYRSVEGTGEYVAVYETDGLDAFYTEAYRGLRAEPSARTTAMLDAVRGFTRFTCTEDSLVGSAPENALLYVVAFPVPADRVAAYDEWYEREHTEMLMAAAGWEGVRRLVVVDAAGGPWTHLTFHYLSTLDALGSPERAAARAAPLRNRLVAEPWFGRSRRWVYEPLPTAILRDDKEGAA
jgi:antibiotic biosynthesis monooxygenase (ABM) superfamily enzyme